jgi:hypothetical protein
MKGNSMKKTLYLSIILTLAVFGTARSQLDGYGLKVATTYPNYDWRTQYPGQGKPQLENFQGYNVALYARWFDISYFSIITQLEYSQRGNTSSYPIEPAPIRTQNNRVSYVSLPVFAKFKPLNLSICPFVLVGPRIDYLIDKKIEDVGLGLYDHLKNWVLGYSIAVGLESNQFLGINISVEARFNRDITNTYHGGGIEIFNKSFDVWFGLGI